MQGFIFWLMGENLGKLAINSWNWLWNIPPQPPQTATKPSTPPPTSETVNAADRAAVEQAAQSLKVMRTRCGELEIAVSQVVAAAKLAQEQYINKYQHWQSLEAQAIAAHARDDAAGARLAMAQALVIDRILPQMLERVDRAQELAQSAQTKLAQEVELTTIAQTEIEALKALAAMNQAFIQTGQFDTVFQTDQIQDPLLFHK